MAAQYYRSKKYLNNRSRHRDFAAAKFRWIKQLALDHRNLSAPALGVANWLCGLFDIDQNGAIEIQQKRIAKRLGMSRRAVIRALQLLVKRGHIRSVRQGDGRSNYYVMQFSDVPQSAHLNFRSDNTRTLDSDVLLRRTSSSKKGGGKKANLPTTSLRGTQGNAFQALRDIWKRPYLEDVPEARLAFELAMETGTNPATIIQGAKIWTQAYHDRRKYLPALSKWLYDTGWTKPPPPKNQTRPNKTETAMRVALEIAGWQPDADGNLRRPNNGRAH